MYEHLVNVAQTDNTSWKWKCISSPEIVIRGMIREKKIINYQKLRTVKV